MSFQLSLLGFLENLSMFSTFVTCLSMLTGHLYFLQYRFEKLSDNPDGVIAEFQGGRESFPENAENSREGKVEDKNKE